MVPTLKVNDTIGFEQPLFYTSSLAGWLVLTFKVIVGLALIGSVLAIVKAERAKPDKPPKVSLLPSTTQRVFHWRQTARRPGPMYSTRKLPTCSKSGSRRRQKAIRYEPTTHVNRKAGTHAWA